MARSRPRTAAFGSPLLLTALVLFGVLYGRYLLGWAPAGGDLVNHYLPHQQLVREAIRSGELPLWNEMTFLGRPLMADIQLGVLYPLNWLHWLLPLPLPLTFALVLALHGALMIWGCVRLGWHWKLAPPAIALGTVLWCAAPFFMLRPGNGLVLFIYVGAWWPWLALGVSQLSREVSFVRVVQLALLLALSLLAGAPQLTFYAWLVMIALALLLPGAGLVRRLVAVGSAFVLALGLTALQTAQTFNFIRYSFERGAGAAWEYITDGSFAPRLFMLLLNPGLLGIGPQQEEFYWGKPPDFTEAAFYLPLWVPLILLPLTGWLLLRRTDAVREGAPQLVLERRLALLGGLGIVAGVLLALGEYSPVFRAFYQLVPGFDKFRVPARMMVWATAGQALLAALAPNRLVLGAQPGASARLGGARGLIVTGAVVGLAALAGTWLLRERLWRALGNPFYAAPPEIQAQALPLLGAHALSMAGMVAAGMIAAAAVLLALLRRQGAAVEMNEGHGRAGLLLYAPAALALLELAVFTFPYQTAAPVGKFRAEFYPATPLVELLQRERSGGRILWLDDVIAWQFDQNQPELFPNRMMMHGLPDARGYDPVNARWIGRWFNLLGGLPPEENPRGFMFVPMLAFPAWLTPMGVELVVTYSDLSGLPGVRQIASIPFPEGPLGIWRNERYRGLAFAAPMPRLQEDPEQALLDSAGLAVDPAAEPLNTLVADSAILPPEEWPRPAAGPPLAPEVSEAFQVTPAEAPFTYQVNFPATAMLMFARSAWPGWTATVDEELVPLAVVNGAFMGIPVPAGEHTVQFSYTPAGWVTGKWISIITLIVMGYGLVKVWQRRRKA